MTFKWKNATRETSLQRHASKASIVKGQIKYTGETTEHHLRAFAHQQQLTLKMRAIKAAILITTTNQGSLKFAYSNFPREEPKYVTHGAKNGARLEHCYFILIELTFFGT